MTLPSSSSSSLPDRTALCAARLAAGLALLAASLFAAGCSRSAGPGAEPAAAPAPSAPAAPPPAAPASAAAGFDPARDWPVPAGWKSETIPFPLEFAPRLVHRGVEELRFAPGMFDPSAPGYWSYAFVWWLEDRQPQDAAALGGELTEYFRGLLVLVASERAKTRPAGAAAPPAIDAAAITCALRGEGERAGWQRFAGEAVVLDTFGDGRRVALRLTVAQRVFPAPGPALGRRAVLVLASPAEPAQPIWRQLEEVGASFAPAAP